MAALERRGGQTAKELLFRTGDRRGRLGKGCSIKSSGTCCHSLHRQTLSSASLLTPFIPVDPDTLSIMSISHPTTWQFLTRAEYACREAYDWLRGGAVARVVVSATCCHTILWALCVCHRQLGSSGTRCEDAVLLLVKRRI